MRLVITICMVWAQACLIFAENSGAAGQVDTSKWESVNSATNIGQAPVKLPSDHTGNYKWSGGSYAHPSDGAGSVKIPALRMLIQAGPPRGMHSIPGGKFIMGKGEIDDQNISSNSPILEVNPYYMDASEISGWRWREIRAWALTHGYPDLPEGKMGAKADGTEGGAEHPVVNVSWFDSIKWCNARSEMEGLIPAYYMDDVQKMVYREGVSDIGSVQVDWNANGYRLPTEAEWEHAAKGGRKESLFPWGDLLNGDKWGATLSGTKANYMNSGDPHDNGTTPIGYYNGLQVVDGKKQGSVMLNDYGLFDMSGNVYEWCWNRFGPYSTDARGPETGNYRVIRGGCWKSTEALHLTSVFRNYTSPIQRSDAIGFRCVRRL